MSLISDLNTTFRQIGIALRDINNRLKEVEVRSAINYPRSTIGGGKNMKNSNIYRQDGTLAMSVVHTMGNLPASAGAAPAGSDYSNVYNSTTLTWYAPNGATVVRTITLTPTADAVGGITALN